MRIKRLVLSTLLFSLFIGLSGCLRAAGKPAPSDIYGGYEYDSCVYINPLSSFMPIKGHMPGYIVAEYSLTITNPDGTEERVSVSYNVKKAGPEVFSTEFESIGPDIDEDAEIWQFFAENERGFQIYYVDSELWLAKRDSERLWSIYRLASSDE